MAEPKAFPYNPVMMAFAAGILLGIWRGMQARLKDILPDPREQFEALFSRKSREKK
ncbi:MAG: hypothetical protein AAF804_12575 [Bacteroidota bacterium]